MATTSQEAEIARRAQSERTWSNRRKRWSAWKARQPTRIYVGGKVYVSDGGGCVVREV